MVLDLVGSSEVAEEFQELAGETDIVVHFVHGYFRRG
jgi:hypothetical protein